MSPIKGDLYRGSLLNFWCVRPDKSMVFNECWCYYLLRGLRWL